MHRLKSACFIVLGLCLSLAAHAQSLPGVSDPLNISTSPESPRANERVTITIQSFSVDLDRALVTWSIDGKSVASGVGIKSITMTAGPLGSTKNVDVVATIPGSGTLSSGAVIRPADVSLVWEADTYVPPFYKGKALPSFGGSFRVTAIPELYTAAGKKIDAHDLVYSWSKNGDVQASASGYGKSSYVTSQTSYLRQGEDIYVSVSAPQANLVADASITVTPLVSKLMLYEKSPLYGIIFEHALEGATSLANEEISVIAEPYYFSVGTRADASLSYSWKLNGVDLDDFTGKSSVTLRRTDKQAGASALGVTVQNSSRLLQGADKGLTIRYE